MNFDINYFKKFENKIALIDVNDNKYTYGDLIIELKNLKKKFVKNSLILIVVSNSFESFVGYFSFLDKSKKCTTIILDESFGNEYFNKIINIYKPNYIFYPLKFSIKKKLNMKNFTFKKYIFSQTRIPINRNINDKNFILLSSSGTTGNPKFIRLSRKNIITNTISIIKSLKISSKDRTITTMPMGYSYGLSIINTHILNGASLVINKNNIFEKLFWQKMIKYKVCSFGGVPQFYQFLKKLNFHKFDLTKIKYISVAGGHLDLNTKKYIMNVCGNNYIKFFSMYGQTETSPRISCFDILRHKSRINTIGKPINGVKLILINDKNKNITTFNKKGEIAVMGENVCLGYANKLEDLYKGDINKSFIKTGDMGYFDEKNFFYIIGRKKKISKIFGIRIDLGDIEKFLKTKKIDSKCQPDNKKLKIKIMNNYSKDTIINLISKKYKINKNFIEITKTKNIKKYGFKK